MRYRAQGVRNESIVAVRTSVSTIRSSVLQVAYVAFKMLSDSASNPFPHPWATCPARALI